MPAITKIRNRASPLLTLFLVGFFDYYKQPRQRPQVVKTHLYFNIHLKIVYCLIMTSSGISSISPSSMIVQTDPEARKLYQFNDVIIKQAKMEEILNQSSCRNCATPRPCFAWVYMNVV